ncbi:hypothetical protein PV364_13500 [Streptomyces sp. MI02-7b]|nr:hypothetical protein [Streptomyces sp. MI02-7b]MDX3073405.1 hypothetical protein [Streptomyces sp. MI02-7b]
MQHGGTVGTVVVALLAVAAFIVVFSRRHPVHAQNVNDTHTVALRPSATSAPSAA